MFRRLIAAAALPLALVAAAAPQDDQARTVEVRTAGLDLNSREGQVTVERRIAIAVSAVCSDPGRDLRARRSETRCRTAARADARRQLDAALASARTPAQIALRADPSKLGK